MESLNIIKAIIGLGNPGSKYANTYHNAGYLVIDSLAVGNFKDYKNFLYQKAGSLILAKSQESMNKSGLAVANLTNFFELKPQEILIVHDDSDQSLGKFKLVTSGGAGGHHGVESIIEHLKTQNFPRLKVGIRKDYADHRPPAGDFVLKKVSPEDLKLLQEPGVFLKEKLKLKETLSEM